MNWIWNKKVVILLWNGVYGKFKEIEGKFKIKIKIKVDEVF